MVEHTVVTHESGYFCQRYNHFFLLSLAYPGGGRTWHKHEPEKSDTTKFKSSKLGRGGRRQNERATAAIVAPEATPPPPLLRQVPAVTRGGYTPHTRYPPTQPQANYLLATGRSETVAQQRSEVKVTVDVHLYHHPGPAQRPTSNQGASYYHTPRY